MVLLRQILIFFAPLAVSIFLFGTDFSSKQVLPLLVLGLSITGFSVVELPMLVKANIDATCACVTVMSNKEEYLLVNTRIYNLGFNTLKNSTIAVYFGECFKVIPYNEALYLDVDFAKQFKIHKPHYCDSETLAKKKTEEFGKEEVLFTPNNNFKTSRLKNLSIYPASSKLRALKTVTMLHSNSLLREAGARKIIKIPLILTEKKNCPN